MDDFEAAYTAVVRAWGVPVQTVIVDGALARTRVLSCGDVGSPVLLCLAGGGDTAAAWFVQAARLSTRYRLIAPDLPGDAGATGRGGLGSREELPAWIDEVLDGMGADTADVLAHSYGAQIAVAHALERRDRVRSLTLLDPTDLFAGLRPTTILRALPVLVAPSGSRLRAYRRWETGGRWPPDPEFGRLAERGADGARPRLVVPRRPAPDRLDELAELPGGVEVVFALRSRYHDAPALARTVEQRFPWMRVTTLPVAHHELPFAYRP